MSRDAALEPIGREANGRTLLPRVSIVIVNYNYGRFLGDAIDSAFEQSYPEIECIVVDNASTDDTPAVLAAMCERHPALRVVQRHSNDGQTPASLDGLAVSTGQYVIFLDADDYLLPHCVETHVYAHLSVRMNVGFTSGDMLQVADRHVVVATSDEMNRFIRGKQGRVPRLVRPFTSMPGFPSPAVPAGTGRRLHYVKPLHVRWIWAPTSGLCYRRDALLLFADNPRLATLRTGTDLYFAFGCSGLSGSVIIDEPLFAYRVHGGNIYTARAQLDRTLNFTPGGHGDSNTRAQLYLVDHLVARAARFAVNLPLKLNLVALIHRVDRQDVDSGLPRWARRSRAAQAIVRNYDGFAAALGPRLARIVLILFARSLRGPARLGAELPATDI